MTEGMVRFKFLVVPVAQTKYTYADGRTYHELFIFGIRVAMWLG